MDNNVDVNIIAQLQMISAIAKEEYDFPGRNGLYFDLHSALHVRYTEEQFTYNTTIQFSQFNASDFHHCNLNNVFVSLGMRYCYNEKRNIDYDKFIQIYMDHSEVRDGKLLVRCSDGQTHLLPLETMLYLQFREINSNLDSFINNFLKQLTQNAELLEEIEEMLNV